LKAVVKQIAELIDSDNVVYLHKETEELHHYPAPSDFIEDDYEYLMDEVMDIVDMEPEAYTRFVPLSSSESYKIMEAYVETVQHRHQSDRLAGALRAKKPFRSFRIELEECDLLEKWYDFKDAYLWVWVEDRME
jgi:Uncharacterised protein family (UPF0158)